MNVNECINSRISIREFEDRNVALSDICDILNNAILAPSSKNRQPWLFKVLKNEIKDAVANIMITNIPNESSVKISAESILKAPVFILIFKEIDKYYNTSDLLSIGAAIENMMLSAVDKGLGSLCIRDIVYSKYEICKRLNVDIHRYELVCGVLIGYSADNALKVPKKSLIQCML